MRTALLFLTCLVASNAWAYDCDYEKQMDRTLDVSGAEQLDINARAGELRVVGSRQASEVTIEARVCASEEDWISESVLQTSSGKTAKITVVAPDSLRDSSWSRNQHFLVDLVITIPEGMALNVKDSSGFMSVEGSGDLTILDSSGGIEVSDVRGVLSIEDSSGDIGISSVDGDLIIEGDSSGNIRGKDIQGSVLVKNDSSGNIHFEDVRDDFIVERDSSGNIVADTIGGDFRVLKDGSGNIKAHNIAGEIDIPEKS